MESQPVRPLDYATPEPRRRRTWLILMIGGIVVAAFFLAAISFTFIAYKRAGMQQQMLTQMATQQQQALTRTSKPKQASTVNFENDTVGSTPVDFTFALTGGGGPVSWVIVEDGGKKVLAQTSTDSTDNRFPVCVFNGVTAKDVEVSTEFKVVSGKVDQAGGVVVRYADKDNYYVVRANALEDNVRLYKVVNGERIQFAGAEVQVAPGEWYRLKLGVSGTHFKVFYEDELLFEANDSTIGNAGKVGLWTKADSVTEFRTLEVVEDQ